MQRGMEYGGGAPTLAPMPPSDVSGLYGVGSPGSGADPPSAPSAPAYSYYQASSVPASNFNLNSQYSQQIPVPSYPTTYNSYQDSSVAGHSSSPSSHTGNLYPQSSYPPAPVPTYPPVGSAYDRGYGAPPAIPDSEFSRLGLAPQTSGGYDPPVGSPYDNRGSPYGAPQATPDPEFSRLGLAPQTSGGYDPPVGSPYDRSYGGPQGTSLDSQFSRLGFTPQPSGGYGSQGSQQGYGGAIYNQAGYEQGGYGGASYDQAGYDRAGYGTPEIGNYGNREGNFVDVYAYDGGGVEPYGARGTGTNVWDSISSTGGYNSSSGTLGSKAKITRATPKAEEGEAELGGVQKFRVKLLPDMRSSDSIKDVVCQIGLDGVRMVDPSTSRTLRIYPLDTITKWEVNEASVFTFWAKSAVDVDQRMIQLKSSSYTTTAILDTLTAACVQVCEMQGKDGPSGGSSAGGTGTAADTNTPKKASIIDWVAIRPRAPTPEEKQHWVPDEAVTKCTACASDFGAFLRRHHCRNCGDIFCDSCTRGRINLNADEGSQAVRVCDRCLAEVTSRLENMVKVNAKIAAPQRTHEDLAKKLQEELERNRAVRKPVLTNSNSGNGSSRQTSVLNCSKCGSISLVMGNSNRCTNCGADSGNNASSIAEKTTRGFGASGGHHGPPHLWSNNASVPDKSGPQMREVACPTCTVHLQVLVPSSGTETIECGVCQHPFLVSA